MPSKVASSTSRGATQSPMRTTERPARLRLLRSAAQSDCAGRAIDRLDRAEGHDQRASPEPPPPDDDLVGTVGMTLVADVIDAPKSPPLGVEHSVALGCSEQTPQLTLLPQSRLTALFHPRRLSPVLEDGKSVGADWPAAARGLPAGRRASREQEHDRAAAGRIGRRRKTNLRRRTKALPALVAAAAALSLVPAVSGCGHRSQLAVTIAGSVECVPDGTTLAEAALIFRLRPQAGNLLDVQGRVLRVGAFPGWLLLDGRRASGATRLQSGDRVQPVQGRDRSEPLRRQLVPVPGGAPSDPQFVLARAPGLEVVVRGALSHALVSARFRPTRGQQTVERAVALTFDDGPSPSDTPGILAVLRRLHAHATFFVIGYLVERYPQLVARERQDGMAIGNHTYNHPEVPPFAQLPRRLLVDEIALGAQSLARLGIRPRLLRPPGGSVSRAVVQAAQALDERVVLWSVDPTDWRPGVTARQIARRVLGAVSPGSIVILHDGGGDRSATVAALPAIIKGIRRRGLRLVEIAAG